MFLRFAYTEFIGILLALFIGVGISAFYQGPKPPETPAILKYPRAVESTPSAETIQAQEAQDRSYQQFDQDNKSYSRNTSMIALAFAVAILSLGLVVFKNISLFSDGFLLGGVLTLIYSIIRGFGAQDNAYRFAVTGVGLFVALLLGYLKMVKASSPIHR